MTLATYISKYDCFAKAQHFFRLSCKKATVTYDYKIIGISYLQFPWYETYER